MPSVANRSCSLARRLGLGLLLLVIFGCGLSDYEALMLKAQKSEERYREEEKSLDGPLLMPMRKDAKIPGMPVAEVFLRPPKGIALKSKPDPRDDLMWQYLAVSAGNDFTAVEVAFAEDDKDFANKKDDKDFANKVVALYPRTGQATQDKRQILPPGQTKAMVFDSWDFDSGPTGYSINILQSIPKPVAVVYIYNKARLESVRKVIKLSLQSLVVDKQQVVIVRERYQSPWQLRPALTP